MKKSRAPEGAKTTKLSFRSGRAGMYEGYTTAGQSTVEQIKGMLNEGNDEEAVLLFR